MTLLCRIHLGVVAVAAWSAVTLAPALAQSSSETAITYVPPLRGAPSSTVVAGTRGAAWRGQLAVLAPRHVAWTDDAQPTLYWYTSERIELPVEVVLLDDVSIDPLLEMRLDPPIDAGVHAVELDGRGVRLEAGPRYRWSVSIVHDAQQRSRDTFAEAFVARVEPSAALRKALAGAGPAGRAREYAAAGYWYDSLRALTALILRGDDEAERWRAERAALLGQVGVRLQPR